MDDAHRTTVSGHALVGGAARVPTHPTLEALRVLGRPGYLPASQYTGLLVELKRLSGQLADAAIVDQVAVLLGGTTLMERLETLLAELDQRLATPTTPPPPAARQRKQRQRRGPTPTEGVTRRDGPGAPTHQSVAHHLSSCGEPCPRGHLPLAPAL